MRSLVLGCVLSHALLHSAAAEAACVISGAGPTAVLPTMRVGQTFSFVATDDCATVGFSTFRPMLFTKVPTPGAMVGPHRRRYGVALTPAEWRALTPPRVKTLVWTATGTTVDGTVTHVTITNEIDNDHDGWTRTDGDLAACDFDPARNPGATDVMENGIDDDCDGSVDNTRFDDPVADIHSSLLYPQLGYVLGVADFDADGIADLAMGTSAGVGNRGTVYVVYGPMSGTIHADDSTLLTTTPSDYIGDAIGAGDADADSTADLAPGGTTGDAAYLLLGPVTADRSVATAEAVFEGPAGSATGADVDIVPDFDGDGTGDVVIGAPSSGSTYSGMVYVASGGSTGTIALSTGATYAFHGVASYGQLGRYDFPIGDVSGDGIADLAFTSSDAVVYLVEGGQPAGSYDVDVAAWASLSESLNFIGQGGVTSGDYDGDGALDLIAGDPTWTDSYPGGAAYAFVGPFAGETTTADATATWVGTETSGLAGAAVAAADVDGDSSLDVLVGAPEVASAHGAIYLQLGFVSGVVETDSLAYFSVNGADALGMQLATLPDWDGDGGVEIAAGAPWTDALSGAVFVFESASLFP